MMAWLSCSLFQLLAGMVFVGKHRGIPRVNKRRAFNSYLKCRTVVNFLQFNVGQCSGRKRYIHFDLVSCIIFCIVKQKYRLLATFGSFSRVVNQRCSLESSNPERFVISHLGKSSAGCCQRPAECYHWKPPMAFRYNLIYLDMELRPNI